MPLGTHGTSNTVDLRSSSSLPEPLARRSGGGGGSSQTSPREDGWSRRRRGETRPRDGPVGVLPGDGWTGVGGGMGVDKGWVSVETVSDL